MNLTNRDRLTIRILRLLAKLWGKEAEFDQHVTRIISMSPEEWKEEAKRMHKRIGENLDKNT